MKKYFILLLLLSGCVYPEALKRSVTWNIFDFSPYLEKGFIFDVHPDNADYDKLNNFEIIITPAVNQGKKIIQNEDGKYVESAYLTWTCEIITNDTLLNIVYEEAILAGANGIIYFDVKTNVDYSAIYNIYIPTYTITGSFVKIINL